jgi:hypothetical protein
VWQAKKWVYPWIDGPCGEALHVHQEQGLSCHMRGLITTAVLNWWPANPSRFSRQFNPDFGMTEAFVGYSAKLYVKISSLNAILHHFN